MVVSAEKARQKAEARRQRILAKSAERMDVVSGLAPKGGGAADEDEEDEPATTVNVTTVVEDVVVVVEKTVESTSAVENDNIPSNSGGGGSKGARRMAAMRRRRYQNKKKEEEATNINDDDNEGKEEDGAVVVEKVDATNEEGNKESSEPTLVEDKTCEPQENEENNDEEPPAAESIEDESSPSSSSSEPQTKKKYMGVARMRRKIIKEQKAQRIAELEAATDNSIDAAATMATLGMTASMIREGSGSIGGEVDLSEVAIKTLRGKKKWWKLVFPPMSLVPRLVTLMLLFMAGLDVGLEPHRARNATNAAGGGGGENLIYHVESSFTKPWEYGMGGKARHMMGMMDAAPPTAMPTSFSREGFCVNGGSGEEEECVNLSTSKKKERGVKEKLLSENNEDEFAGTTDEHDSRPKGVSTSEFDDEVEETYTPPIIDPIFQVDLDALLQNSQLPAPINFAAKFAIGFHRMWVRYLWTVPTSILKSILYSPKTLITSWTANPPVFLFISLLIRVIGKVLVGNTPQEEDENDPKGKKSENLDILGKIKDTAVNYATSSFPKTILVLKTLKEVVTVDMYVILCGLLVGLVTPLVKQDLGFGEILMGGGKVLGDGEL